MVRPLAVPMLVPPVIVCASSRVGGLLLMALRKVLVPTANVILVELLAKMSVTMDRLIDCAWASYSSSRLTGQHPGQLAHQHLRAVPDPEHKQSGTVNRRPV